MRFESGQHYWRFQVERKHKCQVTRCKAHGDHCIGNCLRIYTQHLLQDSRIPLIHILNHNRRAMMPNAARQVHVQRVRFSNMAKGEGRRPVIH